MSAPPDNKLRALVEGHLDGSLSRVEMAELEDLLREPQSLDYYLEAVEIEAGLHQLENRGEFAGEPMTTTPIVARPFLLRPWALASAAALALLVVAGGLIALRDGARDPGIAQQRDPDPAVVAARVVRHIGLALSDDPVLHSGDSLAIDRGLLELEFESGSRMLLEGPARLEMNSPRSALLHQGRCLVTVPRSEDRFSVHCAHGSAWSREGEFAVAVSAPDAPMELGVFEGRSYLASGSGEALPVNRGHALRMASDTPPMSIAFPFESIHRRFPTRELAWSAPSDSFDPVTLEHDLNGLIWGPGPYRVYFKWMHGPDALVIHSSELLLDGTPVARDVHLGVAGDPLHTDRHAYQFDLNDGVYRTGNWSLRTVVQTNPRHLDQIQLPDEVLNPQGVVLLAGDSRLILARDEVRPTLPPRPNSNGVLLVEQGCAAEPYEFCHEWEYVHNGLIYRRTFFDNGTARLERDGEILPNFDRATWNVEDGVLTLSICHPDTDDLICIERHLLREDGTLLFLDRPYRSARRLGSE